MFKPFAFESFDLDPFAIEAAVTGSTRATALLDSASTFTNVAGFDFDRDAFFPVLTETPAIFAVEMDLATIIARAAVDVQVDHNMVAAQNGCCACAGCESDMMTEKQAYVTLLDRLNDALESGAVANTVAALSALAMDLTDISSDDLAGSIKEVVETLSAATNDGPLFMGDIPGNDTTTTSLAIGGSQSSTRENGTDTDWFRVELEAGVTYTFIMLRDGDNPHRDPFLKLFDSASVEVAENDDVAPGQQNSMITFEATTSGTYFLEASGYQTTVGDYTVYAEAGNDRPDFTVDQAAFFLTDQFSPRQFWDKSALTYDISGLAEGAQTLALLAMNAWAEVSGLTFTAVSGGGSADLVFNQDRDDDNEATAFASTSTVNGAVNQVTITISDNWSANADGTPNYALNSYQYQTYLHEVGHALGLGHGGPYNGSATYSTDRVYNTDAWNYTVMSYFDQGEAGSGTPRLVLGLQQVDILAIQSFYGVNTTTRNGDTIYGFNSTETDVFNFETTFDANGIRPPSIAIFDTGGTDTLDFSGYSANQTINLNAETFSNIGDNTNTTDSTDALVNNISIARGSVIENAVGGTGNDTIIGNDVANILTGGLGNDTLNGGGGEDVAIYSGNRDQYTITQNADGSFTVAGADGTDTLTDVETGRFADGDFVFGESQFTFTEGNDAVNGTAADDLMNGLGGDDTINGLAGNDQISGGNGNDTLGGDAGNDRLFGDGFIALTGTEGEVWRAYQAVFDRAPDLGGFNAFTQEIRLGNLTQEAVVTEFVGSTEFQNTYGSLNDQAFVEQLYLNVLDRVGDAEGVQNFTNEIAAGNLTRAQVVLELANSTEFINLSAADSAAFAINVIIDPAEGSIFRLYQAAFDRAPDVPGFTNFVNVVQSGNLSTLAVATEFLNSTEFQNTYGELTNAAFVEALYSNVLPGNTDAVGRANFTAALDAMTLTREAMLLEFADSQELRARTDAAAESFVDTANAYTSDVINGGVGSDVLFGGEGRDTFAFNADMGTDTIMDFTSGVDVIDIVGNSAFTSFGAVQAVTTQDGLDTVITLSSSNIIRLSNVDSSTLTAADFTFSSGGSAQAVKVDEALLAEYVKVYAPASVAAEIISDLTPLANQTSASAVTENVVPDAQIKFVSMDNGQEMSDDGLITTQFNDMDMFG